MASPGGIRSCSGLAKQVRVRVGRTVRQGVRMPDTDAAQGPLAGGRTLAHSFVTWGSAAAGSVERQKLPNAVQSEPGSAGAGSITPAQSSPDPTNLPDLQSPMLSRGLKIGDLLSHGCDPHGPFARLISSPAVGQTLPLRHLHGKASPMEDQCSALEGCASGVPRVRPMSSAAGGHAGRALPLRQLVGEKKEYAKAVSVLRKQYADEHAEKERAKARAEQEQKELQKRDHALQVEAKKVEAARRAVQVAQEQREMRKTKEEQRKQKAEHWQRILAKQGTRKEAKMAKVIRESVYWVKEKDLDRMIREALADPYYL